MSRFVRRRPLRWPAPPVPWRAALCLALLAFNGTIPDPTAEAGSPWVVTDVIAKMPLAKPVTMQDVKTVPKLKDMALLRYSRLSVQPVTAEEWKIVCRMGGVSP